MLNVTIFPAVTVFMNIYRRTNP